MSIKSKKKRKITNGDLYLLVLLPVLYYLIFKYYPMYGAQIAFRDYSPVKGIMGSPWVGWKHFTAFINSYNFDTVFFNTIFLSLYNLAVNFPIPIILAISLNYCLNIRFKKTVQMVTYAPHFISTVVICGMIVQFLSPRNGEINMILSLFGAEPVNFMGYPEYFKSIYVWTQVWQQAGWSSIIYLAALSGIDPSMHEAAIVDGADIIHRIFRIDLPSIMPTMIILLILNLGRVMQIGFEKALLLQNPLNISSSEIIQTYVYKVGLAAAIPNYSYSAAIGFFSSAINLALLVTVNRIAKKLGEVSLW